MSQRWAYMGHPAHNPPSNDCPSCTALSRVWFRGGKTVDGVSQYRYLCDNGHEWLVRGGEIIGTNSDDPPQ